jgi:hypothetical protein
LPSFRSARRGWCATTIDKKNLRRTIDIEIDRNSITVLNSGGVAAMIGWTATATGAGGITSTGERELEVVNPPDQP